MSFALFLSVLTSFLGTWCHTSDNDNPILRLGSMDKTRTEVFARYNYSSSDKPFLYQLGDGSSLASVVAKSRVWLSDSTVVWGSASYTTGKRMHVKWNSTADYALLYPYVMGDSLGGNLSVERYTFSGGWTHRFGKWSLGAQMRFRAGHEYRTVDPRPRSIVTNLTVLVGAGLDVNSQYLVSLKGGARFYKQTNDVAFYREAGIIPEYQFVGLGMDYKRFSGSRTSAYYKATGLIVGAGLAPRLDRGLDVSLTYEYTPYKRILPTLNSMPISNLYLYGCEGRVSWAFNSRWKVYASVDYEKRVGDEYVSGSSSGTEYRTVTQLTMYHAHNAQYMMGVAYRHAWSASRLRLGLDGGYTDFAADYHFPHREMNVQKAVARLSAEWNGKLGKDASLALRADVGQAFDAGGSLTMPYATMDEGNTRLVNDTYAHLKDAYTMANFEARYEMPLSGKYRWFVALNAGYTGASVLSQRQAGISAGIAF